MVCCMREERPSRNETSQFAPAPTTGHLVDGHRGSLRLATSSLARNALTITAFATLGAGICFLAGERTPVQYTATTMLLASPIEVSVLGYEPATSGLSSEVVVLETHIQLMRSSSSIRRAAEAFLADPDIVALLEMAGWTIEDEPTAALQRLLERNLVVRQQGRAEMIAVSVSSSDPDASAGLSNAFSEAFVAQQTAEKLAETRRVADLIEDRVLRLEQEAEELERVAGGHTNAFDTERAARSEQPRTNTATTEADPDPLGTQTQLSVLESRLATTVQIHRHMMQRLAEVREQEHFVKADLAIVSRATPPVSPSTLGPWMLAAMGFIASGFLATLVAIASGVSSQFPNPNRS